MAPRKIAVLGGGASSLSAVWKLTSERDWKNKYDITVYTLGFRLGGKGASGRDAKRGYRIQEHGLHLWFGFYENAHAMLRSVLKELDRPASVPIRTWEQAMRPHNQFAMEQVFRGDWHTWSLDLPVNTGLPGDGSPFPTAWEVFEDGLEVLYELWMDAHPHEATGLEALMSAATTALTAIGNLDLDRLIAPLHAEGAHALILFAREVVKLQKKTAGFGGKPLNALLVRLLRAARTLIGQRLAGEVDTDLEAYRAWITIDAVATILIGVLEDNVLENGFDVINTENFNDWSKRHGASQLTLDSCLIQSAYDSSFAFFRRANNPDFEAGTVLRGAVRMFLMFKGSVVYRFAAGCGDTVFAPLYELLRNRGVRFEFFHEVTEIVTPSSGAMEVTQVQLNRQVDLKNPSAGYQPLINVQGLPCWPSEPQYDQLVQGAQLQAQDIDLESHWTSWTPVATRTLQKGVDFDDVICGLSLEPLKLVAPTLLARNAKLAAMVQNIKTVRTQAFQLWTLPDLAELGWTLDSPLLSTFGEPLDTWADLSLTLPTEAWPASQQPKCVGYFCGAMTEGRDDLPPRSEHGFPALQDAQAKQDALDFINARLWALWPKAFNASPRVMNWDLLADVSGSSGPARFDQQFWRANIDPSERYVLSVTNTTRYRLRCDQTGFSNLYLVGDYTLCGINAGSMEASFISGLQAARAVSGGHDAIPGEGGGFD